MILAHDFRPYFKPYRDPTRRDVEDLAEEIGAVFWDIRVRDPETGAVVRQYWWEKPGVSAPETLAVVPKYQRPDWRGMLQRMGSTWA